MNKGRNKKSFCALLVAWTTVVLSATSDAAPNDNNLKVQKNGQPVVPTAFYALGLHGPYAPQAVVSGELSSNGYDYVLPFWGGTDLGLMEYLDAVQADGLKVMIDLTIGSMTAVTNRVLTVKDHPAVWGYYLADEPKPTGPLPPSELKERYDAIKAIDPNPDHPIFVVQNVLDRFDPYLDVGSMDIIGFDIYPVFSFNPDEFDVNFGKYMVDYKIAAQKARDGGVPLFAVPQFFEEPGARRLPTLAEQRYLTFAPILAGARGIKYFLFEGVMPTEPTYLPQSERDQRVHPAANLVQLVSGAIAIDDGTLAVASLTGSENPDFFATEPGLNLYQLGQSDDLRKADFEIFGTPEESFLLVTNNTNVPQTFDFTITGLDMSTVAENAEDNQTITPDSFTPSGFNFSDTFSQYEVKIYRFEAVPGLLGDFDLDADVDGDDFLLWQLGGSPNPLTASDLADWEMNFGMASPGLAAGASNVPEPTAIILAMLGSLALCSSGVARRQHYC